MKTTLDTPIRHVIELLVQKKFSEIVNLTGGTRLDATSIHNALSDYGRTLVMPPDDAYKNMDVIAIKDATPPRWSVRMNLWTVEEGMSDLSIELTVTESGDDFAIELDDIQVL